MQTSSSLSAGGSASEGASSAATATEKAGLTPVRRVSAGELFGGARELLIMHNGREYHLRVTQQGKLLLTA